MKLYDVPKGSQIRLSYRTDNLIHPPAHRDFYDNEIITFHHIDGMYSFCTDKNGRPVHLAAWTEVEVL